MTYTLRSGGYVKFLRGTPAAWAALTTKDDDTLYFIAEKDATKGKLYLGSKLISGGDLTTISTINDISDVLIEEGIVNNSLLVYDSSKGQWVNKTITEALASASDIMVGATATKDGISGLVPAPTASSQDLFLRADATWADPTAALSATIATLVGDDINTSIRAIAATEVAKIVNNAPESYDTLKEIADWISNSSSTAEVIALNTRVTNLETALSGEGGINSRVTALESSMEALKWKDIVEDTIT